MFLFPLGNKGLINCFTNKHITYQNVNGIIRQIKGSKEQILRAFHFCHIIDCKLPVVQIFFVENSVDQDECCNSSVSTPLANKNDLQKLR